jgi:heme exporter protein A
VTRAVTNPPASTTENLSVAVAAEGLGKTIDDKRILHDIGFTIDRGRYTALLGANGAGKSTLLKLLATLIPPSNGTLRIFDADPRKVAVRVRSRIGMIGHESLLYRDLSPKENLVLFGRLYGVADPARRARDLLDAVGLAGRALDPVKTFSRGMVQRASIARALMHDPDLLLADEPFAGLDAPSCHMLEGLLEQLQRMGKTILLVNHDIPQSLRLAEQILVLRQGRLVIDRGSAELDASTVLEEVAGP